MPMRRKGSDFYVSSDKDLMGMGLGVMPYNNGIGVRIPISRRPENGYEYKVDIKSGQLVPVR